jgi:hypothetical protein
MDYCSDWWTEWTTVLIELRDLTTTLIGGLNLTTAMIDCLDLTMYLFG